MKKNLIWRTPCNGWTYIELLMALSIGVIVIAVATRAVQLAQLRFHQIQFAIESTGQPSILESFFRRDLRCAALGEHYFFAGRREGDGDRLDFVRSGSNPDEFWHVAYVLRKDESTQKFELWRECGLVDKETISNALLCRAVQSIRYQYFNGESWVATWGWNEMEKEPSRGIRGLPMAVRLDMEWQSDGEPVHTAHMIFPIMISLLNSSGHV